MLFAKLTLLNNRVAAALFFSLISVSAFAQSNSPFSRYGLGDMTPPPNLVIRGMGGVSAGFADFYSINSLNPASYSSFFAVKNPRDNKLAAGRVILDVGLNFENRTLVELNNPNKFTSSDPYFSHFQFGVPLRRNWGFVFGLRPLSRIGYKINKAELLTDPVTGQPIDSIVTQFNGTGGAFLPQIGTGFAIKNLSLGINMGYLFGRRDITTNRAFINDTVAYYAADYTTNYSYGSLFFNAGMQYKINLKNTKYVRLGFSGNWKQNVGGSRDELRRTYTTASSGEVITIDTVFYRRDLKGELTYPPSYTAGFVFGDAGRDWMIGADFTRNLWSQYEFFGEKDSVQDGWKVAIGGQYRPKPARNYFSNVGYRAGINFGQDYIAIDGNLPTLGASVGLNLPIRSGRSNATRDQRNFLNLSFEYLKRGDNQNALKENMFRLSLGFSFTDLWFLKRRYE